MVRSGKGLANYLTLGIKFQKRKKARTDITDINNQLFSNFLKDFKNSPCLCYRKKQVHNEPTAAYFFLIKHASKQIKINNYVWLRTKRVKSDF